jgi:hypothetical protein
MQERLVFGQFHFDTQAFSQDGKDREIGQGF